MNLAYCKLAVCPCCGYEKEIIHLLSGNTIGAVQWSDTKYEAPKLPKASPVQKCPKCGMFYFYNADESRDGDTPSFEKGWLDFDDAVKAYRILWNDSNPGNNSTLLFVVVWAYNDIIRGGGEPLCEQTQTFTEIIAEVLKQEKLDLDIILKAELFREIGYFEDCINLLSEYKAKDSFLQGIVNLILENAKGKNKKVVKL